MLDELRKQAAVIELNKFFPCKDANGQDMVIGERYEMYMPVAKDVNRMLGLVFNNDSAQFVYTGCTDLGGVMYICSPDVSTDPNFKVKGVYEGSLLISDKLQGSSPVCPITAARGIIRPATNGS